MPCITLRGNTEWVEMLEEGWNVLSAMDKDKIIEVERKLEPIGVQRMILEVYSPIAFLASFRFLKLPPVSSGFRIAEATLFHLFLFVASEE